MGQQSHPYFQHVKSMPIQMDPESKSLAKLKLAKVSIEDFKVIQAQDAGVTAPPIILPQMKQLYSAIGTFLLRPPWRRITSCL